MITAALLAFCSVLSFLAYKSSYWALKVLAGFAWIGLGAYWAMIPFTTAGSPTMTFALVIAFGTGIAFMMFPFWYTREENGKVIANGIRLPHAFGGRSPEEEAEENCPQISRRDRAVAYSARVNQAIRGNVERRRD